MPRVVHFEIHAEDPERARRFYASVFGWEFSHWAGPQDYWLIRTGPAGTAGIAGGMMRRMGPPPADGQAVNAYACTVEVPSVDSYVASVQANGGTIALPKFAVPGVGWVAYAKDTEGNIFGLHQPDPGAR